MSYPTIYTDANGQRVIIRHLGPQGRGLPAGGNEGDILVRAAGADYTTTWAPSPETATSVFNSSGVGVAGNVAIFASAFEIEDSGVALADLATTTQLATKVTAESGKGLSQESYTSAEKEKLNTLEERYRGTYATEAALDAAVPSPALGDYAYVGTDIAICAVAADWTVLTPATMTALEIAGLIFQADDVTNNQPGAVWDTENCRIYTQADKSSVDTFSQWFAAAGGGLGAAVVQYVEKSADYILTDNDRTVNVTSSSPTLSLPTALTNQGRVFTIKNSGVGTVTVDCDAAGQKIDGDASVSLATKESITVQSTGSGTGYIII